MEKIDCIEDYFAGTRAYYLYFIGTFEKHPEYLEFILDKKYLNGAKVACVSNIMLAIKEDLVDTKGAMDYQSKVFLELMENSVGMIATKVSNGYKIGNYVFPDAVTLVAILRNKLAHGKYRIDFEHNRVILEHKGVDIVINIDRLVNFIMSSLCNKINGLSSSKYERNLVYLQRKTEKLEKGRLKDAGDVKRIIKSYNCLKFKVESTNGMPIFPQYLDYFNNFVILFNQEPYGALKSDYYKKMKLFFEKNNYVISTEYFKLDNDEDIDKIAQFVCGTIINNPNLNYSQQVRLIGEETQRKLDEKINGFNSMSANIHNLFLLDAIDKTKSVSREVLSNYIANKIGSEIRFSYDEYGMSLINMFSSLFMYPFDDVFETSGEYKINRGDSFDFGDLDLSLAKPNVCIVDESPIKNLSERLNSLLRQQNDVLNKINLQQTNLSRVDKNSVAFANINANISSLKNTLSVLMTEYLKVDSEHTMVKNDYMINRLHFENKAIIEGIRNAIAHGHYEFNINGNFLDTEIIFTDIYEGKITFQLRISFADFEELINNNYNAVLNYVRGKIKKKQR